MSVIDCSKCIHCEVCGDQYANDGRAGECSYFLEYNQSGDCISREDLKEAVSKVVAEERKEDERWAAGLRYALTLIDNSQAVEPEIAEKQAVLLLINSGWLVNHDRELREKWKRPSAEWQGGELGHCTNCGHKGSASDIWNGCTGMFCPNCGAPLTDV